MNNNQNHTHIYHFSHFENLEELARHGKIFSKNELKKYIQTYKSSAFEDIQEKRSAYSVPVSMKGTIHDYVPFYFNSKSPMLYTISRGSIDNVHMKDLVFFRSTAQIVDKSEQAYAFTDGHGIMTLSEYYDDIKDLINVPWDVINAQYWNDYDDGKRLRQSEFLVFKDFSWDLVEEIGVYDSLMESKVKSLISDYHRNIKVSEKKTWFF